VLLYGDQVPEGKELEIGLAVLKRPSIRGTDLGILYEPEKDGDIKMRMMSLTDGDFMYMCGGLTQALGKVVVETDIGRRFDIKVQEPETRFVLETGSGPIPIRVDVSSGVAKKVTTNMRSYVEECYRHGVRSVRIGDINAMSIGVDPSRCPPRNEFLVLHMDELNKVYPDVNFWKKDDATLDVIRDVYARFMEEEKLKPFLYGALYDMKPEGKGDARFIFRFVPTMYDQEKDYEEACGTGTVAVGIAMIKNGSLKWDLGTTEVLFELGSKSIIKEEFQVESSLWMDVNNGKVTDAAFSHSSIEIIARGTVYV